MFPAAAQGLAGANPYGAIAQAGAQIVASTQAQQTAPDPSNSFSFGGINLGPAPWDVAAANANQGVSVSNTAMFAIAAVAIGVFLLLRKK